MSYRAPACLDVNLIKKKKKATEEDHTSIYNYINFSQSLFLKNILSGE